MSVTYDLAEFGYRELSLASDLLKAYSEGRFKKEDFFSDGVRVAFNQMSGAVFLTDDDLNVGVLNEDGEIEQFFICGECGNEGTIEEFKENWEMNGKECKECKRIISENED